MQFRGMHYVLILGAIVPLGALAAPTVYFNAPTSGQTLSGTSIPGSSCNVSGTQISKVVFFLDTTQLNTDGNASNGLTCVMDTTKFANGAHTLKAVAYDKKGATATATVAINIQNVNPPPTVSIKAPLDGATLSGAIALNACEAIASDANGIREVQFYLGETLLTTDASSPYMCSLDTTQFPNGAHTLKAVATDVPGAAASATVTVNIQNAAAPIPVAAADILGQAQAHIPFVNQTGYTGQVLGTRPYVTSIPETGIHGPVLPNGETLRLGKVADPADLNRKALAFQVHPNDTVTEGSKRSEIAFDPNVDKDRLYWVALSVYVNDWGSVSTSDAGLFGTQLHSGDNSIDLSPAFGIYTANGRNFRIEARYSGSTAPGQGNTVITKYAEQPIPFGRWVDFVFKFKLNTGASGLLQVWMDGTQIVDRSGPLGYNTPGFLDYIKFGYYNWSSAFNSSRKVLLRSPMIVADPSARYSAADLRAFIQQADSGAANQPPTVALTSPGAGATLSGTASCAADATDDVSVASVKFSLGSTLITTDTAAPYTCSFDTAAFPNGQYTLMALASDAAGLTSTAQRDVTIQNAGLPPPPPPPGPTLPSDGTKAINTFESIGLYWTPPADPGAAGCQVRYRKSADTEWKEALAMWYDARNLECRGSIVQLAPGTDYNVQFSMPGQEPMRELVTKTWSESFPIARVVYLDSGASQVNITEGGSASGYVLYTSAPGTQAVIDVANSADYSIAISAPYVIVRGLTLKGARIDGIRLLQGAKDVVIEDNDISGWGRYRATLSNGWQVGLDRDSAIRAQCSTADPFLERVTVQRNKLHHPRYTTNSWDFGHPLGPQAITFSYCGGNHVLRYNEVYSDDGGNYLNDGFSGEDNFSNNGFPNSDSDIYGNRISHVWDDAIEAEGNNRNVRIWGNYFDQTSVGIASTVVHSGPLYIFRNVQNRSRHLSQKAPDADDRNSFLKSGAAGGYGNGRRWVFHNTMLQATQAGVVNGLGGGQGLTGNTNQPMTNTVSRNNIFHIWKASWISIGQQSGSTGNDANYDLYNGAISSFPGAEANGLVGTPIYAPGHGWENWAGGNYQLAPNSLGYDRGARLANFNDGYLGAAPDIGAHEAGSAAMKFGLQ